jgi:hypothetical protein
MQLMLAPREARSTVQQLVLIPCETRSTVQQLVLTPREARSTVKQLDADTMSTVLHRLTAKPQVLRRLERQPNGVGRP